MLVGWTVGWPLAAASRLGTVNVGIWGSEGDCAAPCTGRLGNGEVRYGGDMFHSAAEPLGRIPVICHSFSWHAVYCAKATASKEYNICKVGMPM
jgi:hypothetical protein